MTLLRSALRLAVVLAVFALATALGIRVLRALGLRIDEPLEEGLIASGVGFFLFELAVFALNAAGWLDLASAWCVLVGAGIAAWSSWALVGKLGVSSGSRIASQWQSGSRATRILLCCTAAVCLLETLVASAPLSGSDAMHYHFAVPRVEMAGPLRPLFDNVHSFLTGDAHLLISLGLALGSDQVALGFIYLGGILTAATLYLIARRLSSRNWALLAVLTFLVSPMVFWQITTSGSPDIWMGFYLGVAVLVANRALESGDARLAILAGLLAGIAAAVKYTGWVVPMAVGGYLLLFFRRRMTVIWAGCAALLGGSLPLVRNVIWTKDPFFPFLMGRLDPSQANQHVLAFLLQDTKSLGFSQGLLTMLRFPFLLAIQGDRYGLGQYFGPVILALTPLLVVALWKNHIARLCATIWALALLANGLTAQMGRFLLPVFGVALALIFSGIAGAARRNWRAIVSASAAMVLFFVAFAGASDLIYAKDFLPVAIGTESKEAFLLRMAPDFDTASFVNQVLGARQKNEGGTVLVFFRHFYYLRLPYVNGDPNTSWMLDPTICSEPTALLGVLKQQNVRWIVKTEYPAAIASAFQQLEAEGRLKAMASTNIESFTGNSRIYGNRATLQATIFEVKY